MIHTADGWRVPRYECDVAGEIGFDAPDSYLRWFERHYSFSVFRRYIVESAFADATVMVLEMAEAAGDLPHLAHAVWLSHGEAAGLYERESALHRVLSGLPEHYSHSRLMPWVRAGGFRSALEPMIRRLRSLHRHSGGMEIRQIKNAYVSSVFRCSSQGIDYYLKRSATVFNREIEVTRRIREWGLVPLPAWLAVEESEQTVLMADMGGSELSPDADQDQLIAVMKQYAKFQIGALERIDNDRTAPFYDYRTVGLAELTDAVPEAAFKLLRHSPYPLSEQERSGLRESLPYWKALCVRLASFALPDSVDHGDLRPGNIRLTDKGIVFFDWAWSAMAHPFFSAVSFLHVIRRALSENEKHALVNAYVEEWSGFAPFDTLLEAYRLAEEAKDLYHVIVDSRWLQEIWEALGWQAPPFGSADAWALERRQYYFARVLRRLIRTNSPT